MTSGNGSNGAILEVQGLRKYFPVGSGFLSRSKAMLKAVDGISFQIEPGKTYGLVGESGCGKSTTAKVILQLEEPTDGVFFFEGMDATALSREDTRYYKSSVQAVFQDPWASLNPRMRVGSIIGEPLEVNSTMTKNEIRTRVGGLLEEVGLQQYQANLFPARILRRPAPTHRRCQGARAEPKAHHPGRARFGAGRFYSRADHEPARRPAG